MDEWSSNDIKRAFRSDGNDGLTDDELKSLANNDVPNGEIHKVPICELQKCTTFSVITVIFNYLQRLSVVVCIVKNETNLFNSKTTLPPKCQVVRNLGAKKTRPGSPKEERMFEVEEILERRGSSPHVHRIKWKGYDNPSDYT